VSDMIVPRTLRPVAQPLGAYFRPNRNDNADVLELLAEGRFIGSGFVVSCERSYSLSVLWTR
jgi:hypothetical protein